MTDRLVWIDASGELDSVVIDSDDWATTLREPGRIGTFIRAEVVAEASYERLYAIAEAALPEAPMVEQIKPSKAVAASPVSGVTTGPATRCARPMDGFVSHSTTMRAGSLQRAQTSARPVATSPLCTPCVSSGWPLLPTPRGPHASAPAPAAVPIRNPLRSITRGR